jgi:hypothetical protein
VKQHASRLKHINVSREMLLHAAVLKDFHQQADRPVVELEHALRDSRLGFRRGSKCDRC